MTFRFATWFLAGVVLLSACKSKKELATEPKTLEEVEAQALYDTLEARQPSFDWFNGSGKMRVQTEDFAASFSVKLRMKADSVIWLQAEKLGFEVARALITPDSAFILDRFSKDYYAIGFEEFTQYYKINFGFRDLQRLLAGGTIYLPPNYLRNEDDGEFRRLTVNAGEYKAIYWFDPGLMLSKGVVQDEYGRTADLAFDDYRAVEFIPYVPFERYLSFFDGESTTELSMQLSSLEVNVPKRIPFSIPSNYDKVDF